MINEIDRFPIECSSMSLVVTLVGCIRNCDGGFFCVVLLYGIQFRERWETLWGHTTSPCEGFHYYRVIPTGNGQRGNTLSSNQNYASLGGKPNGMVHLGGQCRYCKWDRTPMTFLVNPGFQGLLLQVMFLEDSIVVRGRNAHGKAESRENASLSDLVAMLASTA